jgi:hypothetical protein
LLLPGAEAKGSKPDRLLLDMMAAVKPGLESGVKPVNAKPARASLTVVEVE